MPILKIKRYDEPFTQVSNRILEHREMSWEAKAILCYLLSKPPDWTVSTTQLANNFPAGRHVVRRVMKELIDFGYAQLQTIPGAKGRFLGRTYVISEGIEATGIPKVG